MIQVFLNEDKHNGNRMKNSSIKSEENKIDAAEVEDKRDDWLDYEEPYVQEFYRK